MTHTEHPYGEQRLIAIEYHFIDNQMRPFQVYTVRLGETGDYCQGWDFDWCRRDGNLIYHNSSSGVGACVGPLGEPNHKRPNAPVLWWDRAFPNPRGLRIKSKPVTEKTINRWGYRIADEPLTIGDTQNPFEAAIEGATEWCERCQDHIDTESLCSHIWWCEKCGTYSAPTDRCKHRRPTSD